MTGGFNPFDFGYKLQPGEKLETAIFYGGYSDHGLGGASRLLHHFEIAHILPQAPDPKLRPVIYNSWEATEFNVSEPGQIELADDVFGVKVNQDLLHEAVRQGKVDLVKDLVARGADLHARDEDICSTPLGWAAKFGQTSIVELLLECGSAPNLPDDPPWATPLAWAIRRRHDQIVELLRQHGAA